MITDTDTKINTKLLMCFCILFLLFYVYIVMQPNNSINLPMVTTYDTQMYKLNLLKYNNSDYIDNYNNSNIQTIVKPVPIFIKEDTYDSITQSNKIDPNNSINSTNQINTYTSMNTYDSSNNSSNNFSDYYITQYKILRDNL